MKLKENNIQKNLNIKISIPLAKTLSLYKFTYKTLYKFTYKIEEFSNLSKK